jgi:hypothetical protein
MADLRTLPTYRSPCDFYGEDLVRPLGYFEGTTSTADIKMLHLIFDSAATSGCSRTIYAYHTISGAGQEGEAVRGRTALTAAAAGTAHGGHFGLEIGSGGSVVGQGTGLRGTFMIPNSAMSGGTVWGAMSEIYAEGTSSDISGTTMHAIHAFVCSGNSTGTDTVENALAFVGLETGTTGGTDLVDTGPANVTCDLKVRCNVNGTTAWLMFCTTDS